MIGVQFQDIGSNDGAKSITNAGTLDAEFAGYDDNYDFPTQMEVWNGSGYDFYGWAGTSGTSVDNDPSLDNTWTDLDAYAVADTLQAGGGFWIKAAKAGTITLCGEVVVGDVVVNLSEGYNIVANPYPKSVKITNFGRLDDGFVGYDDNYDFPTTMEVWTGSGYSFYGWAGTSGTSVDNDPTLDYTWTDLDAYAVNDEIPAGVSVWIKAAKSGTITFSAPAAE